MVISSVMATKPFQISSNDSWISSSSVTKPVPLNSGLKGYFTPATPLAQSSVAPVVSSVMYYIICIIYCGYISVEY